MEDPNKKYRHYCPHDGCSASFCRPYRLTDHLFSAHTNVRAYVCQEVDCNKSYSNKSHLIRHVNVVHKQLKNDMIYSCPSCMKSYVNRQNLKRHLNKHHSGGTTFTCDFCNTFFTKKNQLKAHIYQHTGVKSFICEICSADFISCWEKKKHLRSHKKYQCNDCQLQFDVWSKYQKHKKTEHASKEFICNDCSRSFKKRCHIVRHVKIHEACEKQVFFLCPYPHCQRSYTRNNNLRAHIAINHLQIKFECHICQAQLSSKAVLNKHLKIHMPKQDSEQSGAAEASATPAPKTPRKRRRRKDLGTTKTSTALRLAGYRFYPICSIEEGIAPAEQPSASLNGVTQKEPFLSSEWNLGCDETKTDNLV